MPFLGRRPYSSTLEGTRNGELAAAMGATIAESRIGADALRAGCLQSCAFDLVLEVAPDTVHDLPVAGVVAQFEHVARAVERHVDDGLGAAGARGHHHDLVGQRD